ncbi:MAG: FAD-dependent oxidoreductase [Bacteroidota bacterium]
MKNKTLIVGAGISGLSVAIRLEEEHIPYKIIDKGENFSSKVAAGIINPVVFRRMALSWRIHDLLPEAIDFYQNLEKEFDDVFLNKIPIRRGFAHEQEKDLWLKKETETEYVDLIKTLDEEDLSYSKLNNLCGTGLVKKSFWISTVKLIDKIQEKLIKEQKLVQEAFLYTDFDETKLTYKGEEFAKIIFCEGFHGIYNPYFSYLPLQATKGELLTVQSDGIPEDESLNRKCFVLPIGNHLFKVGSTYKWDSPDTDLTEQAKDELCSHLENLVSSNYEVVNHEAGIRPTVLDRRPLLGEHPTHKNVFIYNGLGAKGYLITPLLSKEFVSYLLGKAELDKEVDIKRYEKLVSK